MIDIHMHIIPGVDDGAETLAMAEGMLKMALEQGVTDIIATSHSDSFLWSKTKVMKRYQELRDLVREEKLSVQIHLGCEVYCEPEIMDEVLGGLKDGIIPSMNGTKYVLTEFYHTGKDEVLYCLEALLQNDWLPIIAHAERYKNLGIDFYRKAKDLGCLLQMNVFSVGEEKNPIIKGQAIELLEAGLVDFLGSDAHRINHRPPMVRTGMEYLQQNYGEIYVEQISHKNAKELFLSRKDG